MGSRWSLTKPPVCLFSHRSRRGLTAGRKGILVFVVLEVGGHAWLATNNFLGSAAVVVPISIVGCGSDLKPLTYKTSPISPKMMRCNNTHLFQAFSGGGVVWCFFKGRVTLVASSYSGQNQSTACFDCWPKCAHRGSFEWLLLSFWPPSTIQDNAFTGQKRSIHFDL